MAHLRWRAKHPIISGVVGGLLVAIAISTGFLAIEASAHPPVTRSGDRWVVSPQLGPLSWLLSRVFSMLDPTKAPSYSVLCPPTGSCSPPQTPLDISLLSISGHPTNRSCAADAHFTITVTSHQPVTFTILVRNLGGAPAALSSSGQEIFVQRDVGGQAGRAPDVWSGALGPAATLPPGGSLVLSAVWNQRNNAGERLPGGPDHPYILDDVSLTVGGLGRWERHIYSCPAAIVLP